MTETCLRKDRNLVKLSYLLAHVRADTECHLSLLILSRQPGEKLNRVIWRYIKANHYFHENPLLNNYIQVVSI